MDLIRRHAFMIIGVVGALAGIALAITGLRAMPRVVTEMEQASRLYQDMNSLQGGAVNRDSIEAEERRIEQTREDYTEVVAQVRKLYRYEPLVPNVFPNGNDDARRAFRKEYNDAMRRLFESLRAGQPPTPSDIGKMKDKIDDEKARAEERGLDGGEAPPEQPEPSPPRTPAGVLTKAGAAENAEARAAMAVAQETYCYAVDTRLARPPATFSSLDFDPAMEDTGSLDAPYPEEVWRAQLGYWIQKDIVNAIVALNEEAAGEVGSRPDGTANGEEEGGNITWVGTMPVKDVISIRISPDYVIADPDDEGYDGAAADGYREALPPGSPVKEFTETASTNAFEVLHFTVKLVMDQRDVLRLVDKLYSNSFHTLLRVAYKAVEPNKNMVNKIYGSEPTVFVVMDFETIMLGDIFRPMMPVEVCEVLQDAGYGMTCPEPADEEEAEEETEEEEGD